MKAWGRSVASYSVLQSLWQIMVKVIYGEWVPATCAALCAARSRGDLKDSCLKIRSRKTLMKRYIWCLHCHRVFDASQIMNEIHGEFCPTKGCTGRDLGWDLMSYDRIRKDHNDWPKIPVAGVEYR